MLLFHKLLVVLTFTDPLEYIPVIRILHHNATQMLVKGEINLPEGWGVLIEEGLLVTGYEGVFDGGEDTDFVQRIFLLTIRQILDLHLLQRIFRVVLLAQDLVDAWVGTVPYNHRHTQYPVNHKLLIRITSRRQTHLPSFAIILNPSSDINFMQRNKLYSVKTSFYYLC